MSTIESTKSGSFSPVSLLKSSGMVVSARVFGAVFGILTQFLLAKYLGAEDIALFFVASGLAAVLAVVCTLGYPMLVPRIAAEAAQENKAEKLTTFMLQARIDTALLCSLLATGLLAAAWGLPGLTDGTRLSLKFAALTLPAFAMLRLNGSLANALKRFGLGFLPDLFLRPLLLLCLVLAAWLIWDRLSIEAVLGGHVVIAALLAVWQMVRLLSKSGIENRADGQTRTARKALASDWRRRAMPMVLAALFVGVFADLDIVVAQLFLDDAQTGIFGVCLKISLFVAFGIQAIHQLILRDTANALNAGNDKMVREVLSRANALTVLGSVGSTLFVVILGRELLGFFGPEFVAGYQTLVVLMLAQVVRALAGPATQILALTGHEKACLPVFAVCIPLLVVGNLVLIYWFGLLGAALTVLIVFAVWSGWSAAIAYRKLGLRTNFGSWQRKTT
jgi:O-antigen/teichoic acid export membrane protein